MKKVITYGSRWAVIDTTRKDEPLILSLHGSEEEARKEASKVPVSDYEHIAGFWTAEG